MPTPDDRVSTARGPAADAAGAGLRIALGAAVVLAAVAVLLLFGRDAASGDPALGTWRADPASLRDHLTARIAAAEAARERDRAEPLGFVGAMEAFAAPLLLGMIREIDVPAAVRLEPDGTFRFDIGLGEGGETRTGSWERSGDAVVLRPESALDPRAELRPAGEGRLLLDRLPMVMVGADGAPGGGHAGVALPPILLIRDLIRDGEPERRRRGSSALQPADP